MGVTLKKIRAITLLELLTVLCIAAVLATLVVATFFRSHQVSLLDNEARKFQSILSLARSKAISENTHYQFGYWVDTPSYWLDRLTPDGMAVDQAQIVTPEPLSDRIDVSFSFETALGSPAARPPGVIVMHFKSNGSSDTGSIWLIRKTADKNDPSEYYTIKLYGPTGRAKIFANQKI